VNHNLTDDEKKVLREMVRAILAKNLKREFIVVWGTNGTVVSFKENEGWLPFPDITKARLKALEEEGLARVRKDTGAAGVYADHVSITQRGYDLVGCDFKEEQKPNLERIRIYLIAAAFLATVIAFLYHLYG